MRYGIDRVPDKYPAIGKTRWVDSSEPTARGYLTESGASTYAYKRLPAQVDTETPTCYARANEAGS